VIFLVVALIQFLNPVFRLVILWKMFGLFGEVCLICGQVRRPPTGGSALGSLRYSWVAGSASVALSVDSAFFRLVVGLDISPLCSLACTAVALSMYMWVCPCLVVRFSCNGV
jgi:hypothetical protein